MRRRNLYSSLLLVLSLFLAACGGQMTPEELDAEAAGDRHLAGGSLAQGVQDWSWDTEITYGLEIDGLSALSAKYQKRWAGLSFRLEQPAKINAYNGVALTLKGSGQKLVLRVRDSDGKAGGAYDLSATSSFETVCVPWSELGSPSDVSRIDVQEASGAAQPEIYLDNLYLYAECEAEPTPQPNPQPEPEPTPNEPSGTALYVSKGGSDSAQGTADDPLGSVEEAVDRAQPGDTIYVEAGTYPPVRIDGKAGSADAPVTLTAAPDSSGEVVFSSGSYSTKAGIRLEGSSHLVVRGLSVQKSLFGIYVLGSDNITVEDNHVTDIGQEAIRVAEGSSFVEVVGNTVSDTGKRFGKYGEGVYVGTGASFGDGTNNVTIRGNDISRTFNEGIDIKPYTKDILIENNLIHDINTGTSGAVVIGLRQGNWSEGEAARGSVPNADNIIIRNNKIWNITSGTRYKDGNGISARNGATIYNNIIWNCEHRGIYINRGTPSNHTHKLYHNTVFRGSTAGTDDDIDVSDSSANVRIENNIGYSQGNNIAGEASLFRDARKGDFRLVRGSSAIDAGTSLNAVATDFSGASRSQGGAPDLGAYEYGGE